jgi:Zn-dependent M28 family amino/carboxypeptidase
MGHGVPEDFEDVDLDGKIVLVSSDAPDWYDRYVHRREKYYYAMDRGAAGFLYQNHVEGCLPPTGSVGNEDVPIGEIPAVGVSSEVGARLARRFDGDEITVDVDADIYDTTSQNVHAELGPETDTEVLVTSHVDAHDIAEGAMDNGAGTAMVVELAKALADREDELETKVHFIVFGAEEVGLVGSSVDARRRDHDTIKAVLNFDGVVRGRTLTFTTHGFEELADAAETVTERYDHPAIVKPEQGPHSDHWPYVKWGVPGIHVMSDTGEDGRGWGHTFADTLDKIEPRNLREQAILLTELAVELASAERDLVHADPEVIAAHLEEEGLAASMKVMGDWPY